MINSLLDKGPVTRRRIIFIFLLPMLLLQALTLALLIGWEKKKADSEQIYELTEVAKGFYQQIIVTRNWNARHGGVYVEITPETQPNPYLDIPDRDIVSVNGKRYTKINPAYMTRQLSEIAGKDHGYWFKIISLKPVNPNNTPDQWEAVMLRNFEKSAAADATEIEKSENGKRVFKHIVPLKTEKPCLRCHEKYGSLYGDIRGGISIAIPMEKADLIADSKLWRTIIYLLLLSAASMLLTAGIVWYFACRLNRAIACSVEKEKLSAILEMAGATAHEMRQPMTVIHSVMGVMEEKVRNNEPLTEEEMEIITSQCNRMNNTIQKMLNITRYRTKAYTEGKNIVDLDRAAEQNAQDQGS